MSAILHAQRTLGNARVARALQGSSAGANRLQRLGIEKILTGGGTFAKIRDEVLWALPARELFRLRRVNKAYDHQIRALVAHRVHFPFALVNALLTQCPALRDLQMPYLARALRVFPAPDGALVNACGLLPSGLSDRETIRLLELIRACRPPQPLSLAQARLAITERRPHGKAQVDPSLNSDTFWDQILNPPQQPKKRGGGGERGALEVRTERQDAALGEVAKAAAGNASIPGLEALATLIHNAHMTLQDVLDHRAGRAPREGVAPPDTQATTCLALFRGGYIAARQNGVAKIPAVFANACTTLGLPGGPVRVLTRADMQTRLETSGMHGESIIIRYAWLLFLTERGLNEQMATQADLYIFYDWLKRELVMGASQGICWDCAGNLKLFDVPHAVTPSEKPSPMWVDPITQEQFGSDSNRQNPGAIRKSFQKRR